MGLRSVRPSTGGQAPTTGRHCAGGSGSLRSVVVHSVGFSFANDATPVDSIFSPRRRKGRKGSRQGISRRKRSSRSPSWWSTRWVMSGPIAFLGALGVFAVNHFLHADRVERLRFQPVGALPSESRTGASSPVTRQPQGVNGYPRTSSPTGSRRWVGGPQRPRRQASTSRHHRRHGRTRNGSKPGILPCRSVRSVRSP